VRKAHPEAEEVEVWAHDQSRLGLKPVMRRVWAPRGERPAVKVHHRYEWTYLYGFVGPTSGEVYWLILPRANTEVFSIALSRFAQEVGAGENKRIVLVLDQAGYHTGREAGVPEGVHLEFLPSNSPELQPAERLWPLSNEGVANRFFEGIEEMEEALVERCRALRGQEELIRDLTNYHWWPKAG
jgi:transposase